MKKIVKRVVTLALVPLLSLSLCACNVELGEIRMIKQAYKHISQMESLSFDFEAQLKATAGKLPLETELSADCRATLLPSVVEAQTSLDLGKVGEISLPAYIFSSQEQLHILTGSSNEKNGLWISHSIPLPQPSQEQSGIQLDELLELLQSDEEALVVGESEEIDGVSARAFKLRISGQFIMDSLTFAPAKSAPIEDTVFTLWISEKDGMPLRLSADIASIANYALAAAKADWLPEIKVESLPCTMKLTGINDTGSIELPTYS